MPTVIISAPVVSITVLAQWVLGAPFVPAGQTVDLKAGLPPNIPSGGTFAASAALPAGMTLSTDGVLAFAAAAASAAVPNVKFTYTAGPIIETSNPVTVTGLAKWSPPAIQIVGGTNTFDLKATLPSLTPAGGVFALNSGTLPPGVALSAAGVLSAPGTVTSASASGIDFSYTFG